LYFSYAVVNSVKPESVHQEVVNLLDNRDQPCPQDLIAENYRYLLLPSQYVAGVQNSCLFLLYESGEARLYRIGSHSNGTSYSQTLNVSDLTQKKEISISGNYTIVCPYCGSRLYYQFQNVVKRIRLDGYSLMYITVAAPEADRTINLLVQGTGSELHAKIVGKNETSLDHSGTYILRDYLQYAGQEIRVQLENTKSSSVEIQAVTLESL
jgi:hypothetical protein